jgi:hypothetical protein
VAFNELGEGRRLAGVVKAAAASSGDGRRLLRLKGSVWVSASQRRKGGSREVRAGASPSAAGSFCNKRELNFIPVFFNKFPNFIKYFNTTGNKFYENP